MRRAVRILVENRCGELERIIGLFRARNLHIKSLALAETDDPKISRITLVADGPDRAITQIVRRIDTQVGVLAVQDVTGLEAAARELACIRIRADGGLARGEILQLISQNRLRLLDASEESLTIEVTGNRDTVDEVLARIRALGTCEVVRSGAVVIPPDGRRAAAGQLALADVFET